MKDIVLIQPPVEDFYFTYKRSIPYGLASIAASLQQNGFSVTIVDCLSVKKSKIIPIPQEMDYLLPFYGEHDISIFSLFHEFKHYGYSLEYAGKLVKDKKPFLVGISSLFTPYCQTAERLAIVVKKFWSNCKIVMGGHHPTVLPYEVMKCPAVDFILRGEGEISMPLLAKAIKYGGNMEEIPGIVFRRQIYTFTQSDNIDNTDNADNADKEYAQPFFKDHSTPQYSQSSNESIYISEPAWIEDFSSIPPPAMELVNHQFYSRSKSVSVSNSGALDSSNRLGSTVVVASRGCPMPCTYCSVGASSSHGKFRQRKVKEVIHELSLQLDRLNIGFIDFEDENLTLNRKWFLELMDGIIDLCGRKKLHFADNTGKKSSENQIELRAMNGLYPPSLDEEMIIAMKKAGFKTLNLSLGSTSSEQLRRFRRPDVRESFEKVLYFAQRHGLEAVSYLIAAAPDQKPEDSLNDLIFLSQKNTLIGLSIFYPSSGSVDYEKCLRRGLLPKSFSLMRSSALPINHVTSRIQSITLLRLARVINFMKYLVTENISIPNPEPYVNDFNNNQLLTDLTFKTVMSLNDKQNFCETKTIIKDTHNSLNQYTIIDDKKKQFDKKRLINRKMLIDRKKAGVYLLKWFLHDGILRGIRSDGSIFNHKVDQELCCHFIIEIKKMHNLK